jgi:hypothetical protein
LKFGIAAAFAVKQFFTPDPLRIVLVANLQPACVVRQVWIELALRDNPFEVMVASKSEQAFAIAVYVVAVEQAFASFRQYRSEPKLAVG